MNTYMKQSVVDAIVGEAGTRFATVTFAKVDGEVRTITGLFRTTKNMVGGEGGDKAAARNKAANLIPICEASGLARGDGAKAWRSFKRDRVISIKVDGHTY